MDITLRPGQLSGTLTAIPSKSMAHRLLICAAFADGPTTLLCPQTSRDIEATADCLGHLGAQISRTETGYTVVPVADVPQSVTLPCKESGSTLRFLLPVVGALGVDATFHMERRLPQRPLTPLWAEMERMGCRLTRPTEDTIHCAGKLRPGAYSMDGSVSSQFITGLLLSMPLIGGGSTLQITGSVESKPYIAMTRQALDLFPRQHTSGTVAVEGDWSNAAFWLAANALGSSVTVLGLEETSVQGDRAVAYWLPHLRENVTISASDTPDLVPVLAVVSAANAGAVFTDVGRLRLKESDRVASVIAMIESMGGKAEATDNTLTVYGTGLVGGTVDSFHDHRIAMAAAIAATVCKDAVTVLDAECVNKSYPTFWEEYSRLGGTYEQHLR